MCIVTNHHHNQDSRHIITLKSFLVTLTFPLPSTISQSPGEHNLLLSLKISLYFPEFHIRRIIQDLSMLLCIPVVYSFLLLYKCSIVWIFLHMFIHLPAGGYLGLDLFLDITNKAVMNICVQACLCRCKI